MRSIGGFIDKTEISGPSGQPVMVMGATVTADLIARARELTENILMEKKDIKAIEATVIEDESGDSGE